VENEFIIKFRIRLQVLGPRDIDVIVMGNVGN
jgi:hypothetical protein